MGAAASASSQGTAVLSAALPRNSALAHTSAELGSPSHTQNKVLSAAENVWQVRWAEEETRHLAVKRSWRAIAARYAELEAAWAMQDPSNETWVGAQAAHTQAKAVWESEIARRRKVKREWQEQSGEPELVQQLELHERVKSAHRNGAITEEQWKAHRRFHRAAKKNWLRMAAAAAQWERAQTQHVEVAGLWAQHTAHRQKADRILARERAAWLAAQDAAVDMRRGRAEQVSRAASEETMRDLENRLRADCRRFEASVLALPLAKKVLLGGDAEDATYQVLLWGMDGILAAPRRGAENGLSDDDGDGGGGSGRGGGMAETQCSEASWRPGVDAEPGKDDACSAPCRVELGAQAEGAAPSLALASVREANVLTMLNTTRQQLPKSPGRFNARGDLDEVPDDENPMLGAHSPFHRLRLQGFDGSSSTHRHRHSGKDSTSTPHVIFVKDTVPEVEGETWEVAKHQRALLSISE